MSYSRKTYDTPMGRYVEEYHTGRTPPKGEKRKRKEERTKEEIEKNNRRIRERNIQLLLMNNFRENDYFATLTYRKEERPPDMKAAKADMAKCIRALRREYAKRGEELKWVYNIERGSRGGWHIHMCINRIRDTDIILKKAWTKGGTHTTLLYEQGGFRQLAGYISKQTDNDEPEQKENGYSRSRNLQMPEPKTKKIRRWDTWKDDIKVPKGFILDKDSVQEGYTGTGYPYRRYVLLASEERRKAGAGGTPLRGSGNSRSKKKKTKGDVRAGTGRGRIKPGNKNGDD